MQNKNEEWDQLFEEIEINKEVLTDKLFKIPIENDAFDHYGNDTTDIAKWGEEDKWKIYYCLLFLDLLEFCLVLL